MAFRSVNCLQPTGISNSILPWVCWSIWKARNTLIFEDRTLSPEETATNGIRLAREWNLAQLPKKSKKLTVVPAPAVIHRPQLDLEATPICKSDAAWNKHTKKAGLAWIITGATNNRIAQGIDTKEDINSPLIVEALAL